MATSLRINEFKFNNLQGTFFAPSSRFLPTRILSKLSERFQSQFDDIPTVLPLPDDAPPEIPRIVLKSKDKQWSLEAASWRLNYRWVQMSEAQEITLESFCKRFLDLVEFFVAIERPRIGRMALVLARYIIVEQPADVISRHFCRDLSQKKALADLANFEIHALRKARIAGRFDINSWTRFKSGQLKIPDTSSRPIVLVEQDVNTLAEEADVKEFGLDEFRDFMTASAAEAESRFRELLEA
jgi:hypothetical protein